MFFLKKALSRLLFPLPLTLLVLAAGIAFSWARPGSRVGKALLLAAMLLLLLFSLPATSMLIAQPLETRYPALGPAQLDSLDWGSINAIVVFAGCRPADEGGPITQQVGESDLVRMIEGVRLYQLCPSCQMVLSGGGPGCGLEIPIENLTNYRFAVTYGVAPQDIIVERESWDTADQARILKEMLGEAPFLLVTSASHMPRSMALLRAQRLHAIAAPTDYLRDSAIPVSWESPGVHRLYPDARALWRSERAIHEYLGLLWATLRGALRPS